MFNFEFLNLFFMTKNQVPHMMIEILCHNYFKLQLKAKNHFLLKINAFYFIGTPSIFDL